MSMRRTAGRAGRALASGLTLIELMVVVALAAIIIGLAAPSFSDYIVTQRVRSIHAQVTTDLQFARSEAVSRGSFVGIRFRYAAGDDGASCYSIYTRPAPDAINDITCDCLQPEGQRCSAHPTQTSEVKTVTIPNRLKVSVRVAAGQNESVSFDPRTGAVRVIAQDTAIIDAVRFRVSTSADTARTLAAVLLPSGRPEICAPAGSTLGGIACTN